MLVDKIDFVEFDRQWRELFVDNPTHELVVDGEVLEMLGVGVPKRIQMDCYHYYVDESGLFLGVVHSHVDNHTVEFRKKQESTPTDWQRAASKVSRIFRIISVGASSTQQYVLNCERNNTAEQYEIYTTFRSLPMSEYSLYEAVLKCEDMFVEMLRGLVDKAEG
jgi:hypothetical protein